MNNSAEVLIVAVEVEVSNGAGLHWGASSGVINFGMGGSLQSPIEYPIALKNSAKKPVKILVSTFFFPQLVVGDGMSLDTFEC